MPVFSFGENEIFDQITGKWLLWLQQKLKMILGLAPCLLKGRGFFQYSFGLLPHRRPIVTVGKVSYYTFVSLTTFDIKDIVHQLTTL